MADQVDMEDQEIDAESQFYMARALKALRIHHRAKKEEVAQFLGVSVETVKVLEKGGVYLTNGDIFKYADFFRVPVPIIICLEEHIRSMNNETRFLEIEFSKAELKKDEEQ